ncbi:MAG: hypothetical protein EBS05_08800 [Proteobacteria bacterium]|nr:hypothetical protein [Pseudomonadota bacterium]
MKVNQWTIGLAAAGVISFGAVAQADEKPTQNVLTLVSSTVLSGYVNTSATWSPGKAAAAPGYSYSGGKNDGFNLNVVDLMVSKAVDETQWAAGYTAEFWIGQDAVGLGNGTGGIANDIAIKNANVSLNAPIGNGLNIKMGIFDSPLGYEAANAGENPNYTRSYGYTIEPTSLTGVLASYKVCDGFRVQAGVANTYDAAINARPAGSAAVKSYVAAITLTAPDSMGFLKGAALNAGIIDGRTSATVGGPDTTLVYVGATIPTPLETLKLGASWDHLQRDGLSDADSFALYASFSGIDKLKINTRVEYFDNGGGAVALGGAPAAGASNGNGKAEVLGLTLTLDYSLWANVITRLEYRFDHDLSQGHNLPGNGAAGSSGNNNAQLLALNVIYKF